jgi:thiol-disulfide isomerase/thioredoxin
MPVARIVRNAICAALLASLAADVPRKAPDFAVNLGSGKQVKLSDYSGKLVAMIFILTTCPHCQAAIRSLAQEQKAMGPRGFQVVASAIEDGAAANVPGFVRQFQPPFPVGYNETTLAVDFMQHPRMAELRMPLIAFIDRQGTIRAQYEGYEAFFAEDKMAANIHAKIAELLGVGAPMQKAAPGNQRKK